MSEKIRALAGGELELVRPKMEELAAYHNRVAASFAGVYPTIPIAVHLEAMRDHVEKGTATILGLFLDDGRLAGFGMASIEGSYGEIDYLFVDEGLRGRGYGKRLLDRLFDYLCRGGAAFVDLRVVLGNPARRFYEKYGFAPRSEILSMHLDSQEG